MVTTDRADQPTQELGSDPTGPLGLVVHKGPDPSLALWFPQPIDDDNGSNKQHDSTEEGEALLPLVRCGARMTLLSEESDPDKSNHR